MKLLLNNKNLIYWSDLSDLKPYWYSPILYSAVSFTVERMQLKIFDMQFNTIFKSVIYQHVINLILVSPFQRIACVFMYIFLCCYHYFHDKCLSSCKIFKFIIFIRKSMLTMISNNWIVGIISLWQWNAKPVLHFDETKIFSCIVQNNFFYFVGTWALSNTTSRLSIFLMSSLRFLDWYP